MNKNVKSSNENLKSTSNDSYGSTHIPPANQQKRLGQIVFSQKLYKSHALEIAAEYEQALEDNSLEKIKILLDKVLEIERNQK